MSMRSCTDISKPTFSSISKVATLVQFQFRRRRGNAWHTLEAGSAGMRELVLLVLRPGQHVSRGDACGQKVKDELS